MCTGARTAVALSDCRELVVQVCVEAASVPVTRLAQRLHLNLLKLGTSNALAASGNLA